MEGTTGSHLLLELNPLHPAAAVKLLIQEGTMPSVRRNNNNDLLGDV